MALRIRNGGSLVPDRWLNQAQIIHLADALKIKMYEMFRKSEFLHMIASSTNMSVYKDGTDEYNTILNDSLLIK